MEGEEHNRRRKLPHRNRRPVKKLIDEMLKDTKNLTALEEDEKSVIHLREIQDRREIFKFQAVENELELNVLKAKCSSFERMSSTQTIQKVNEELEPLQRKVH